MTVSPITAFRVKPTLTPNRRRPERRPVENTDYAGFVSRVISAHGRRVQGGDIEGLPALVGLATELDQAITSAVTGLRAAGYSWAEIAGRLGITRQAAHQRWGHHPPGQPNSSTTHERGQSTRPAPFPSPDHSR